MYIYINNEKIDFTLENEKTTADILHSLEQWLAGQKLIIVGLEINGEACRPGDLEAKGRLPLDAVRELRVAASDFVKLEMDGLAALKEFFATLQALLAAWDEKALAELLAGYPQTAGTLRFILSSPGQAEDAARFEELDKLFSGTTAGMVKLWKQPVKDQAAALCSHFLKKLENKNREYATLEQSGRKITREAIAKLRGAAERLSEVSVLLQTGKDAQAMQTIASFTEMAQLFLHLASDVLANATIEGTDVQSYSQTLNDRLRELVQAFEKKDYILIGDLCEYEIAPKIISMIDTVETALGA